MIPQEIIRRKRDGESLDAADLADFVRALAKNEIPESQVGAFAMAVFFKGMSRDETVALTLAMRDSGTVLDWSHLDRPVADKHSTGGVGDNVSLMLAPILAACGVAVPMISGRGLGHTGGTLDKLQSIPGYDIAPDLEGFRRAVDHAGCAIVGQTADLAPADGRLYAIRDVTATVESIPLITASILSKKLAAGLGSLVLDVKVGSGAFMADPDAAEALARTLVEVGSGAGLRTAALLTDMNEPLADTVGNALEVASCLDFLSGRKRGTRLEAVVLALAEAVLCEAGVVGNSADAAEMVRDALSTGKATEAFARMVHALGGPADFCDKPLSYLPKAPVCLPVTAARSGYLARCNARTVGMAVVGLGGGRRKAADLIDHRVGFDRILPLGTSVEQGDPLAFIHAATPQDAQLAMKSFHAAYGIEDEPPALPHPVIRRIG